MGYLEKLTSVANSNTTSAPTPSKKSTPGYLSKLQPVDNTAQPTEKSGEGIGGFLSGLVKAPLTIAARPIQAIAELAGAKPETVDKVTSKLTGGLVAPVPQNFSDVEKDVGRGAQTVALGLGPVSGGALFGAGNSLEQGNDLLSTQTAFQTVLGGAGGKVLDLVGKPLLDAAGKVVGKITPQTLKDVAGKGANAISEFAANHSIPGVSKEASNTINKIATNAENIANKPFEVAGNTIKKPFVKTPEQIVNAREKELAKIDDNYSSMRKASGYSDDAGVASRKRVAQTDVLVGSVDDNGLIRTKVPGGAIDQYKAQTLDGAEGVVRNNLERLGETVKLSDVEKELTHTVNSSGLEGSDLKNALNNIKKEISGYKLKADAEGKIPLTLVHDAKISTTNGINYQTPPEIKTYRKAIARGLKKTVEKYSSFNTEEVNKEISKYLEDVNFLERLDGKRVRGGKLGKYFAQISGNIVGGLAGGAIGGPVGSAAGTVLGGEVAGRIKGSALENTLGGRAGYIAPKNEVIDEAIGRGKSPRLALPAPREGQPRIQINSGEQINLPERSESKISAEEAYNRKIDFLRKRKAQLDYEKSLGNRNQQYKNTATPNKINISESLPQPKSRGKLPTPKVKK